MKKYIVFLFVLAFVVFNINVNFVNAETKSNSSVVICPNGNTLESNCAVAPIYKSSEDMLCPNGKTLSSNCMSKSDGIVPTLEKTKVEVDSQKPACMRVLNEEGVKMWSRGENVKALQQTLKDEGFLTGKVDGVFGPMTEKAKMNFRKKCPIPGPTSGSIVIRGVSGPQKLDVGETGKWKVSASDKNDGNLSYTVNWGDEPVYSTYGNVSVSTTSLAQQSATFTHSYLQAGTYNPTFTVTSPIKVYPCFVAPCPTSGGSAQTSLSVKVGSVENVSALKVLSPNGGESWTTGNKQTIKWEGTQAPCPEGYSCAAVMPNYDITLSAFIPPCTSNICPMTTMMERAPYTIAKNVSDSFYDWRVGDYDWGNLPNNAGALPPIYPGSYTIQVCQTGTNICDSSDNYFQLNTNTTN